MDVFDFEAILNSLKEMGVIDLLVPAFLLFILLFYAFLESNIFNKRMAIVASLALTGLAVIPQTLNMYDPCWNLIEIINNALGKIAILLAVGIVMYVVLAIIGINTTKMKEYSYLIFSIILIVFTSLVVYSRPEECIDHTTNFFIIGSVILLLLLLHFFGKKSP